MMGNKSIDSLIDEFYGENNEVLKESHKASKDYIEFKSDLRGVSEKLEVLRADDFDFEIDTLSIIEKAESIKENKKAKKEMIIFIFLATLILIGYGALSIIYGKGFIIVSQIIIMTIMPWCLIPFALFKSKGSEV